MSSYKALYRKYRPQTFKDVVDQEHVTRTLENAINLGHISHAYLFNGPRGIGKTSIARIFAKAINCLNPNGSEPCGECEVCKAIMDSSNPDIIEIDAASRTRVEQMRDILEKTSFLPTMSKYKVYIIDEVHMLSQSSFNALLKTLEEPPAHVIFILCTTEVEKVIPTIRSRCQRFDFHLIDKNAMVEHLENITNKENINISHEAISLIAEAAEGGMRDALSLLDQVSSFSLNEEISEEDVLQVTGKLSTSTLINMAEHIYKNDPSSAINTLESLLKSGKEVERITQDLISFYKDILVIKNTERQINKVGYDTDVFKVLVSNLKSGQLYAYIESLTSAMMDYRFSTNKRLYLELALIKICGKNIVSATSLEQAASTQNKYDPNITYKNPFLNDGTTKEELKVETPILTQEKEEEKAQEIIVQDNEETIIEEKTLEELEEQIEEVKEQPETILEVPEVKETQKNSEIEYDIHFIEEILNNSDKPFKEAIIEKISKSTTLTKGTDLHKYSIMLDGSQIRASSRGAFIMSFEVVGQCNLVLKEENYKGIKNLIKTLTGNDLDFIAIPQNLWNTLSSEYVGIYKANIKNSKIEYINLTPVPCPGLVTEKTKAVIEHDNKYKDLEDLFGEDFIKIK